MKTIPPILITILVFVLGIRMYKEAFGPLGPFMIFTYIAMCFLVNVSIPSFVKCFKNESSIKKGRTFFLIYSIALLIIASIFRMVTIGPINEMECFREEREVIQALFIVVCGMSCSSYNVYATLDEKIKKMNKKDDV